MLHLQRVERRHPRCPEQHVQGVANTLLARWQPSDKLQNRVGGTSILATSSLTQRIAIADWSGTHAIHKCHQSQVAQRVYADVQNHFKDAARGIHLQARNCCFSKLLAVERAELRLWGLASMSASPFGFSAATVLQSHSYPAVSTLCNPPKARKLKSKPLRQRMSIVHAS